MWDNCTNGTIAFTWNLPDRTEIPVGSWPSQDWVARLCYICEKIKLTKAGTTLLTGKPPSVSSLPMTSSWHISMAAWSCWDSSPVACRPCSNCWALEPGKRRCLFIYLGKSNNKLNQLLCLRWLYLLAPLPMVLWNSCDMRGPKGPKRCGGRPLASSRAAENKTTTVPNPTSPFDAHYRCAFVKSSRMIASFLAQCQNSLKR